MFLAYSLSQVLPQGTVAGTVACTVACTVAAVRCPYHEKCLDLQLLNQPYVSIQSPQERIWSKYKPPV